MASPIKKRFSFIGKSLLWSLLLYMVMMLAFNWEDLRHTLRGEDRVTVVNTFQGSDNTTAVPQTVVTDHKSLAANLLILLKTISGISFKTIAN